MGFLTGVLVLCLYCALTLGFSGVCKHPRPLTNFNMRRFSGSWYYAAFSMSSPRDEQTYGSARCGVYFLHQDKGESRMNKLQADLTYGNSVVTIPGTYYLPDPSKSLIIFHYIGGNYTYDYTVLCTDYDTYHVAYACIEVTPAFTSEITFIFMRHPDAYEEVMSLSSLPSCLKRVTNKTPLEIPRHSRENCLPEV